MLNNDDDDDNDDGDDDDDDNKMRIPPIDTCNKIDNEK